MTTTTRQELERRLADLDPDSLDGRAAADAAEAIKQAGVLLQAATASPDQYARTLLRRLGTEWHRAAVSILEVLEDTDDPRQPRILPVGALAPGTLVYFPTRAGTWAPLVRTMTRDGQCSLHLEEPDSGRAEYVNLTVPGSPVVIAR